MTSLAKHTGLLRSVRWGFALLAAGLLLAQHPEAARHFAEAEQAFAASRYEEAAKAYRKAAVLDPGAVEIQAKLGLSYFLQRKCEQAVGPFERAVELKPDLATARVLLAICHSELGRYQQALPDLEKGFENPPNYEGVKRLIGLELQRSYLGLGQYAKAGRIAAELQLLYPDDPEVLYHAVRTYGELALETTEQLSRAAPDSVWVHQALGEAYESRQFHDLAILEYQKALEKEPGRPGLHFRLGQAMLARAGDATQGSDALAEFRKELELNPGHAAAAYQIGEILRQRSQLDEALGFFEQVVRYRPSFEEARVALGRVLLDLKRPVEARPHLEKAVELNEENYVSRYLLARVYRELGERERQREQLEAYRKLRAAKKELAQAMLSGVAKQELDEGPGP